MLRRPSRPVHPSALLVGLLALVAAPAHAEDLVDPRGQPRLDAERLVAWYLPASLAGGQEGARRVLDLSARGRHGTALPGAGPGGFAVPPAALDGLEGPLTVLALVRVDAADGGRLVEAGAGPSRRALSAGSGGAPGRWTVAAGAADRAGAVVDVGRASVVTVEFGAERTTLHVDGLERAVAPGVEGALDGLAIGAGPDGGSALAGQVLHVALYRGVLERGERRALERFLAAEAGPRLHPPRPAPFDLFTGGDGLYHTYRIPAAVVTRAGTLLAFAEGRASRADHARNDLVLRRCTDGGRRLGPVRTLFEAGHDALNNPCVVELRSGPHAGRVLLFFQRYLAGHDEHRAAAGYDDPAVCRTFVAHSDDDGLSWSEPREITRAVKPPEATSTASGPGAALQLREGPHAGRVVLPLNHGPFGSWRVYAAYSDDGGETWTRGEPAPDDGIAGRGNEVQMVELPGGELLLNARAQGGAGRRVAARSTDGGATWSPLTVVEDLVEPQCMGSVLALRGTGERARLVYSGPRSERARVSGTLMVSDDLGATWRPGPVVEPGAFAYSQLVRLDGEHLGVLYERDGYRSIALVRVPLAALR